MAFSLLRLGLLTTYPNWDVSPSRGGDLIDKPKSLLDQLPSDDPRQWPTGSMRKLGNSVLQVG